MTAAYEHARLVFVVDADDPTLDDYFRQPLPDEQDLVSLVTASTWKPMVHKLNEAALVAAGDGWSGVAFMGDDHLPRTHGWAGRYLEELADLGTGIVFGNDLLQGSRLPTQWAMTPDIIRALGRMVPADVEHLYCDNAMGALGEAAECLRYLPDVVIEHMHPVAAKARVDDGYRRVNSPSQYARDQAAFTAWVRDRLPADAETVRALRKG